MIFFLSLSCCRSLAGTERLCYWVVRHGGQLFQELAERPSHRATYLPSNSSSSDSRSYSTGALSLGGSTQGATLPATCRATRTPSKYLSGDLPSDSHTERLTCRGIHLLTRLEHCHLPSTSPASDSLSDSPRSLLQVCAA
jgi:hypothetical protein